MPFDEKERIMRLCADFVDGATRRVMEDGAEREVVVSRVYPAFQGLAVSRKKGAANAEEEESGRALQAALLHFLKASRASPPSTAPRSKPTLTTRLARRS